MRDIYFAENETKPRLVWLPFTSRDRDTGFDISIVGDTTDFKFYDILQDNQVLETSLDTTELLGSRQREPEGTYGSPTKSLIKINENYTHSMRGPYLACG